MKTDRWKCVTLGLSCCLGSTLVNGEYHLEKAKIFGDGNVETMFLCNGSTGAVYWSDTYVDTTDPKNQKNIVGWRKVEKDLGSEIESIESKKAQNSSSP